VRAEENWGERSPLPLDKIVQFAPENHGKFWAPLLKIRQNQCVCVCGRFLATGERNIASQIAFGVSDLRAPGIPTWILRAR
jgi:hypothetical protein